MKSLGEDVPGYKLREIIQEVDKNQNGTVEFDEFLEVTQLMTDIFLMPFYLLLQCRERRITTLCDFFCFP